MVTRISANTRSGGVAIRAGAARGIVKGANDGPTKVEMGGAKARIQNPGYVGATMRGEPGDKGEPGEPGDRTFVSFDYTLTGEDIENKGMTLPAEPKDPAQVALLVYGGIEQKAQVDFQITASFLSWDGLALELLLEEGSTIAVRYFRKSP